LYDQIKKEIPEVDWINLAGKKLKLNSLLQPSLNFYTPKNTLNILINMYSNNPSSSKISASILKYNTKKRGLWSFEYIRTIIEQSFKRISEMLENRYQYRLLFEDFTGTPIKIMEFV
jgi:transposase